MKIRHIFAGIALVAATTSAALAVPAATANSPFGVLADKSGMTLYIFDKDTAGVSTCYDGCDASWPPFIAKADAADEGDFTLVAREDGAMQWAYKGMPLYYWAGDSEPGDATGDGIGGVWHVIK